MNQKQAKTNKFDTIHLNLDDVAHYEAIATTAGRSTIKVMERVLQRHADDPADVESAVRAVIGKALPAIAFLNLAAEIERAALADAVLAYAYKVAYGYGDHIAEERARIVLADRGHLLSLPKRKQLHDQAIRLGFDAVVQAEVPVS